MPEILPEFDLSQFDNPKPSLEGKPPTISDEAWALFQSRDDDEYWIKAQAEIRDTGTERAVFIGGPYNRVERITPRDAGEVIVHGALAPEGRDWPGNYIYRRRIAWKGPLPVFDYVGPVPQPDENAPTKLVLPFLRS